MNPYVYSRSKQILEAVNSQEGSAQQAPSILQLVKDAFHKRLNPAMAFGMVVFAAIAVTSMSMVAYSEVSGTAFAPLAKIMPHNPSKVLGVATYGYSQPICGYNSANCLNYQLIGFSGSGWQVRIDYQLSDNITAAIKVNSWPFMDNLQGPGSGSGFTGYDLIPGRTYDFVLYSKVGSFLKRLTNLSLTAPPSPITTCAAHPTPAPYCYYDNSSPCGGNLICNPPTYNYTSTQSGSGLTGLNVGWIDSMPSNNLTAPGSLTLSGWAYSGGNALSVTMVLRDLDNNEDYNPDSVNYASYRPDALSYLSSVLGSQPSFQNGTFFASFSHLPAGRYIIYNARFNGQLFNLHNQVGQPIYISGNTPQPTTPSIFSLSPASGPVGTVVTIKGAAFNSANNIKMSGPVSGTVATKVGYDSDNNTLTFTIPSNIAFLPDCFTSVCSHLVGQSQQVLPGSYSITVTNSNGTSNAVSFNVTQSPEVSWLTPTDGQQLSAGSGLDMSWSWLGTFSSFDLSYQPQFMMPCPVGANCPQVMPSAVTFASNVIGSSYHWNIPSTLQPGKYSLILTGHNSGPNGPATLTGTITVYISGSGTTAVVYSVAVNPSLASPITPTPNGINQKLASFVLTAGNTSAVNLAAISIQTASTNVAGNFQNLKAFVNGSQIGAVQATIANGTTYGMTPLSPIIVPANGSVIIDVYADVTSAVANTSFNQPIFNFSGVIGTQVVTGQTLPSVGVVAGQNVSSPATPAGITLSQSNIALLPNQTNTVQIYASSNNVYISSNSNTSVASASISGNSLSVNALAPGTTVITVCLANSSSCANLYVTVTGSITNYSLSLNSSLSSPITASLGTASQKLASFTFTAGNTSSIYINSLSLQTASTNVLGNFQNLKVFVNGLQFGNVQATLANGNLYAFNGQQITVPANGSVIIDVFADVIANPATSNYNQPLFNLASLQGQLAVSGASLQPIAVVNGQAVVSSSIANGASVMVSMDATSPAARQVTMGSSQVVLGIFKFQETGGSQAASLAGASFVATAGIGSKTSSGSSDVSNTFSNFTLWNNGVQVGSATAFYTGSTQNLGSNQYLITINNLNVNIPAGGSVVLTLKADVNSWAAGAASNSTWTFGFGVGSALTYQGLNVATTYNSAVSSQLTIARTKVNFSSIGSISNPALNISQPGTPGPGEFVAIYPVSASPAGNATINSLTFQQAGSALPGGSVSYSVFDSDQGLSVPVGTGTINNSGQIVLNLNSAAGNSGVVVPAGGTKNLVISANTIAFGPSISSGSQTGTYNLTLTNWGWSDGTSNFNMSGDSGSIPATVTKTYAVTNNQNGARVGSIIVKNGTVYLVGNSGLYGFPDLATFNSWGFTFPQVVAANSAEQALSQVGIVPMKQAGCTTPLAQITGTCGTTVSQPTAPVMSLGPSSNVLVGVSQQFNFLSQDSASSNLSFAINWGDGSAVTTASGQFVSGGYIVGALHTWTTAGSYTISVSVTDGLNNSSSATFPVTVVASSAGTTARLGAIINKGGTVYLVGSNGLYGFPDLNTFNSWNFNFSQVVPANTAEQALTQVGTVPVKQSTCSTPLDQINGVCPSTATPVTNGARVGSIINKSGTIYLVGNNGLYGFTDLATFNSWGFTLSQIVIANTIEMNLSSVGFVPAKAAGCSNPLDQINGICH